MILWHPQWLFLNSTRARPFGLIATSIRQAKCELQCLLRMHRPPFCNRQLPSRTKRNLMQACHLLEFGHIALVSHQQALPNQGRLLWRSNRVRPSAKPTRAALNRKSVSLVQAQSVARKLAPPPLTLPSLSRSSARALHPSEFLGATLHAF